MEVEIIHGQIVAKANHYQAVPGKFGKKRIIKDEVIRAYERSFIEQCKVYRLSLIHISEPTRQAEISYAVFCLKKKKNTEQKKKRAQRKRCGALHT